jgi:hypothetical protein
MFALAEVTGFYEHEFSHSAAGTKQANLDGVHTKPDPRSLPQQTTLVTGLHVDFVGAASMRQVSHSKTVMTSWSSRISFGKSFAVSLDSVQTGTPSLGFQY